MKVAIIGAGNMGGAIARGLARGSMVAAADIVVSNPSAPKLDALRQECPAIRVTPDNQEAANGADVVILAVKPWLVGEVLGALKLRPTQVLASVAAGITFSQLSAWTGNSGMTLFRLIPNTAISLGESMTVIASHRATPQQEEQMLALFSEMGVAMLVREEQMAACTALASCGIAYALKYIQAAMQAGTEMGIRPADAARMVAQSVKGAAQLILQGGTHPATEIDKVCTPGGLTIRGLNQLEQDGFSKAVINAMKKSL